VTTNPNVIPAADLIAGAMNHGGVDSALGAAAALDGTGLLARDPFVLPGRHHPAPSPAAVAALVECRKAKAAADLGLGEVAELPGEPKVSAAAGEVRFVVRPRSLEDWHRWTRALGVHDAQGRAVGGAMIARFTYRGVRARLVGEGGAEQRGHALARGAR
jgi:hypothetical protein